MTFDYDFFDIDWQSVCENQQVREFEWQLSLCHEWEPDPEEEDVEPWHDPTFIARLEAQAESAEKELDMLLDIDFRLKDVSLLLLLLKSVIQI